MLVHRDITNGFYGSWQSGLGTLHFKSGDSILCENTETVRAFEAAFGNVIQPNHTAKISGHDIAWTEDELGLVLGGFTPYADWLAKGYPEIPLGGTIELD